MLDLVHHPTHAGAGQEQAAAVDLEAAVGEWTCSLAPNPPGAVLLLRRAANSAARHVEVRLDGEPAKEHPSVYVAPTVPEVLPPGQELEYLFVLVRGTPSFTTVDVRWTDADGRQRAWRRDTTRPGVRSLI